MDLRYSEVMTIKRESCTRTSSAWPRLSAIMLRAMAIVWGMLLLTFSTAWALSGTIVEISGTARVMKASGQQAPAIRGDNLYEGDAVFTGALSNVQIRMVDNAVIWLRPQSEFRIDTYRTRQRGDASNSAALRLLVGSLRTITGSIAPSAGGSYTLNTPVATIGIRGTEFDAVHANPQYASLLGIEAGTYNRVYQGATGLTGPAGTVTLNAGEAGFVGLQPGATPAPLTQIPPFLNLPGNSTLLNQPGAPSAAPTPSPSAAGPSVWQLSLWLGELGANDPTMDNANPAKQVRIEEGVPALWDLARAMTVGLPTRPSGNLQQYVPMRLGASAQGDLVRVTFTPVAASTVIGTSSSISTSNSTLDLPVSRWTEVTGRGPWTAQSRSTVRSSRGTSVDALRVYVKLEKLP